MARIADSPRGVARLLRVQVERAARAQSSVEEAAQALCELTFEAFEESVVLARVFATVPFCDLPIRGRANVQRQLEVAGIDSLLNDDVLVLTLLGSFGIEANWRDRSDSVGHVGIPLVSSSFVQSIPMIAMLLRELGVPFDWMDQSDTDTSIVSDVMGTTSGVFYVRDAASAVDHKDRKIITEQDFVRRYDIKTVFGAGGGFLGSSMLLVAVVFARETVERSMVDYFIPVVNATKLSAAPLIMQQRIFASRL